MKTAHSEDEGFSPYRVFTHVTRGHICMNLHKNRVQSPKEYLTPPTWPPFLCLLLQHSRRDVMWTHSIETVAKRRKGSEPRKFRIKRIDKGKKSIAIGGKNCTKEWRPWCCTKLILRESNSIFMQILSFLSVIQYGCWSREWKRSIIPYRDVGATHNFPSLTCNRPLPCFMNYKLTSREALGCLAQYECSSDSNIVPGAFPSPLLWKSPRNEVVLSMLSSDYIYHNLQFLFFVMNF